MEHPDPFRLERAEQPEETIENSSLNKVEEAIICREINDRLPDILRNQKKTALIEWIPPEIEQTENGQKIKKRAPGASYLGIIKITDQNGIGDKYVAVEVLLTGSLHVSKSVKKEGVRESKTKSNISVFNNLKELFNPNNLSDAFRLRLREKLVPLIKKAGLKPQDVLRLGSRPLHEPPPHKQVEGL